MSTENKHHVFYVAIKWSESGQLERCRFGRDFERLKANFSREPASDGKNVESENTRKAQEIPETSLANVMNRIVDTINAQSELIPSARIMGSVMYMAQAETHLAKPIENRSELIENVNGVKIYGLDEETFLQLAPAFERVSRFRRGVSALPAALLMSIVATFDSSVADIVRAMLTLKSNTFQVGEKTIPLGEVLQASPIDEIKAKILDDEIYQFSRGSHEDQVKYIEKVFHINIIEHWKRWPDFVEVFERRNLIAHGEKSFTERYVAICKKHNHKGSEKVLGARIELSFDYLKQANEILLEFAILLVFSLWRKHFAEQKDEAFSAVNQTAFELIRSHEYTVPIRVLEYVLSLKNVEAAESTRRMMVVNLASAYAHSGNNDKCAQILDGVDWSASSDNYKICVAALKSNLKEVCRLMPLVEAAGSVTKSDIREWPVFDFVRDKPEVIQKFEEVYKEPMVVREAAKSDDIHNEDTMRPHSKSTLH